MWVVFPMKINTLPRYCKIGFKGVMIKTNSIGVLICGTGIGISIAANKVKGIRCAVCHSIETAEMAKKHNNANIIALQAVIMQR